jgi:N-acyl-D-amino-acid deacylase
VRRAYQEPRFTAGPRCRPAEDPGPPLNRRTFTALLAAAAARLTLTPRWALEPLWAGSRRAADWLLRGAAVYDGTGAPPVEADVVVEGAVISAIGPSLEVAGAEVLDLRGLALAPGFVDIHSHTDIELLVDPRCESKVRQGVTTEVTGPDGSSMGPWSLGTFQQQRAEYRRRYGIEIDFRDPAGFLLRLERERVAVNVATMVGAGTVRSAVVGSMNRPANRTELARMATLVRDAVRSGACGLSTGLEYAPGGYATIDELVALCDPLRGTGLPYASHMRSEDDELLAAVEETLEIGRRARVPVHISHFKADGQPNWWKGGPARALVEAARESGVEVTFDRYPYAAWSTGLSQLFPIWTKSGGTRAFLGRISSPTLRARIESAVRARVEQLDGGWDGVLVSQTGSPSLAWAQGRRLGALAAERGVDPYDLLVHLVRQDRDATRMVGFGMNEEDTERMLAHPLAMIASDGSALATSGPLSEGAPHPRNYGTFPRVLGHYARERRLFPLEVAIMKMTSMPADRVRLGGRGRIAVGGFADLVAFDPARVADLATFERPHQYPTGIVHVMVNGRPVVRDGEHTGELPGRVLRPATARHSAPQSVDSRVAPAPS